MVNLVEVLKRTYGLGSRPDIRMKLYKQLQRQVEVHGERAYVIIRECMQAATAARHPDRWFAVAAMRRLTEKLGVPNTVDEAIAGVFRDAGERAGLG